MFIVWRCLSNRGLMCLSYACKRPLWRCIRRMEVYIVWRRCVWYEGVYCIEVCVVWRCLLYRCVHGMEVSIDGGVYCIEVCVVWRCLLYRGMCCVEVSIV